MNTATFILTFTLPLSSADTTLSRPPQLQTTPPPIVQQLKIMPQIGVQQGSGIRK